MEDFERKTGRKYWWPPEPVPLDLALSEELERWMRGRPRSSSSNSRGASPSEIRDALRELEARGVIYITFDRRRGVQKLRLSRAITQCPSNADKPRC